MKTLTAIGISAIAALALIGCTGEKPLSEDESMASVLKSGGVSPEGKSRDGGAVKPTGAPAAPEAGK